tara:strand:+ start:2471 stop:3193 length:723 start_codon:yes stop_codon:yes gene_type:complete
MAEITMNDEGLKRFERDLKRLRKRALPFATREALNSTAKAARGLAKKNVRSKMILRNKFTLASVQAIFERKSLIIDKQRSIVGSTQPYMERQEFGGRRTSRGRYGVPIPTRDASNEGRGASPRKKLPTRINKLRNIRLRGKRKGKNRRHTNALIIQHAIDGRKTKHVFMKTDRGPGIYSVKGMAKGKAKVKLIHDLSYKAVAIPKRQWLLPAVDKAAKSMPANYKRSLRRQLIKHGIFKG